MINAINYPDWADLGLGGLSADTRNLWDNMLMMAERHRYYFDGDVFKETVALERSTDEDPPLLYPVGLNLIKMLCLTHADSVFGEWEEQPIHFGISGDRELKTSDEAAIDILNSIAGASHAGKTLWETELERHAYGGSALKIEPVLSPMTKVRWSRVMRGNFFPIWDPDDPDKLLEAYAVVIMTNEQARAKYGFQGTNDYVTRVEHWNQYEYTNYLDRTPISKYSGKNPYGVVPFVYIPRFRMHTWWGESLTEDIIPVQDDLNRVVADISDAINYNAHPVRWGINLPRDFNAKNYPLGPNALWNLGRSIAGNPKPEVGIMEATAAVQEGVFSYVNFVYDWSRVSSSAPPIVFGDDEGGGQRSGITLELRMWPILKSIRRSRSYLSAGISQAIHITGRILAQKKFSDISSHAITAMLEGRIVPQFFDVMPRDQAANVDEVVKLGTMDPPHISIETSQKVLGRGVGEVERIKRQMTDKDLEPRAIKQQREIAEKQAQAFQNRQTQKEDDPAKDDRNKPVE